MVVQTKTYTALVSTIWNPFLIKKRKKKRRKKRQFHSKIVILDVETTFPIQFLSNELQCLPRGDPENLCENTKIQLLITHLFPQNFKDQAVRIKIVQKIFTLRFDTGLIRLKKPASSVSNFHALVVSKLDQANCCPLWNFTTFPLIYSLWWSRFK